MAGGQLAPVDADHRIAITVRYQMLDALNKSGVLAGSMENVELRQNVFAALASLPSTQMDAYPET